MLAARWAGRAYYFQSPLETDGNKNGESDRAHLRF